MPANRGRKPPHEIVDVVLRNGKVIRGIKADGWRWRQWPEGPHDFDIVRWQVPKS
jgi:hypothetical protein